MPVDNMEAPFAVAIIGDKAHLNHLSQVEGTRIIHMRCLSAGLLHGTATRGKLQG